MLERGPSRVGGQFATTNWIVVLSAYVRCQGHSPEDAQDLTQAFFVRLLEKKFLQLASPEGGKFRSFLLTSLKHFLIHERQRGQTDKRGGGCVHRSRDQASAEDRYQLEPASELTPGKNLRVLRNKKAGSSGHGSISLPVLAFAALERFK
jgi:DNA-directed RNA polymerase specialized sigma24 family protein